MSLKEREIYRFGPFLLDPAEHILLCEGTRLSLTSKAFETLLCLVRHPGRLLTKEELIQQVWPDTFVEDVNLAVNISTIRKVLGESPQDARYIATVPGRGYRFIAEVVRSPNHEEINGNLIVESSPGWMLPEAEARPQHNTEIKAERQVVPARIRRSLQAALSGRAVTLGIPGLALFLLVAAVADRLWHSHTRRAAAPSNTPSIAVLPFEDLSPGKDQAYLSSGLAEELIDNLARVPGLKVVARSSAFQFNSSNEDVRSIGKRLGVANVLEGSVQRQGNRVRIRVELVRADDGTELWSETYDREAGEVFSVQDEIARAATSTLQVKLLGRTKGSADAPVTSREAYEAYLKGQYFLGLGDSESELGKALSYADEAIRQDPNYAPAWALRSRVRNLIADFNITNSANMSRGYDQARQDAERAIVLNPNLAEGYLALGWIQMNYDWNWSSAEASLTKAADLEPENADVLHSRSLLYEFQGNLAEAIEAEKRAISLDPLRARYYSLLGYQLYFSGKYDESDAALAKALELNPQKEQDHITRGELLLARGHAQEALAEMEQEPDKNWKLFGEALVYYRLGRMHDSDVALKKLIGIGANVWACQIAQIYAYRGERDKAFEWLDRAYRLHDGGLPYMKVDFILRSLSQDPRYTDLLAKMRLPA